MVSGDWLRCGEADSVHICGFPVGGEPAGRGNDACLGADIVVAHSVVVAQTRHGRRAARTGGLRQVGQGTRRPGRALGSSRQGMVGLLGQGLHHRDPHCLHQPLRGICVSAAITATLANQVLDEVRSRVQQERLSDTRRIARGDATSTTAGYESSRKHQDNAPTANPPSPSSKDDQTTLNSQGPISPLCSAKLTCRLRML